MFGRPPCIFNNFFNTEDPFQLSIHVFHRYIGGWGVVKFGSLFVNYVFCNFFLSLLVQVGNLKDVRWDEQLDDQDIEASDVRG